MNRITYDKQNSNKLIEKTISVRTSVSEKGYDTIKIKRGEMQINLEFPPKSARDQLIEQEVKAIIAGELKEKSRRYIS